MPADYYFSSTNVTMDFSAYALAVGISVLDDNDNLTQAYTNTLARVSFSLQSLPDPADGTP